MEGIGFLGFYGLFSWQIPALYALCAVCSYLIGNLSPAILIGKACGVDIKKEGSGNAGTTNVLRVLGKKAAAATLVIDIGKGCVAVLLGKLIGRMHGAALLRQLQESGAIPEGASAETAIANYMLVCAMICMIAVFCGHIWPVFFGFKGGKGVATAFGALAALDPRLGFSLLGVVILVVLVTRRVSAGSVTAALLAPVITYFLLPQATGGVCIMAAIVVMKHGSNIKRLLRGEEPKLSFKK